MENSHTDKPPENLSKRSQIYQSRNTVAELVRQLDVARTNLRRREAEILFRLDEIAALKKDRRELKSQLRLLAKQFVVHELETKIGIQEVWDAYANDDDITEELPAVGE